MRLTEKINAHYRKEDELDAEKGILLFEVEEVFKKINDVLGIASGIKDLYDFSTNTDNPDVIRLSFDDGYDNIERVWLPLSALDDPEAYIQQKLGEELAREKAKQALRAEEEAKQQIKKKERERQELARLLELQANGYFE